MQNENGGWGSVDGGASQTYITAEVLLSLSAFQVDDGVLDAAFAYLNQHYIAGEGYGDRQSSVLTTALILNTFASYQRSPAVPPWAWAW